MRAAPPILAALAPALALALFGCAPEPTAAPSVTASDAWARAGAPGQTMAALYVTLSSNGDDRLVGADGPAGTRASLHDSRRSDGMAGMAAIDSLALRADEAAVLAPGGRHLMLAGLEAPLAAGDIVPVTLRFAEASPVRVGFTVVAAGAR